MAAWREMSVSLRVRAIDEAGAPVAGAIVRHHDEDVGTTDVDGIAIVPELKTGFDAVTVVSTSLPAEEQLTFSLGEGSSGIVDRTVVLHRGAPVRGTVVTPDGTPLPGAMLELWSEAGRTFYIESADDGAWSVPALRAGAFEVRAGADDYARGPAVSGMHDGRTEQGDVLVRVALGARLVGRARNAAGQAVPGASIYLEMTPADPHYAVTDDDGRFEIVGLGAGRYHIRVGNWTSTVVMPGDGEQHDLDVTLPDPQQPSGARPAFTCASTSDVTQTASLTGRVLRDGAPVSRFAIVRKGFDGYHWITDPAMIEAPDGRFTLDGLREVRCHVHILALGSQWTSSEPITLEPGKTHELGDITLQPGLRITGSVCNAQNEPIAGARVMIGSPWREDPLLDAVDGQFSTTTGLDGTFVLEGVHLRHDRVQIAASHPVHGASLHHTVGCDESIELVLVPTGTIDGVVEPHSQMHGAVTIRGDRPELGGSSASLRPSGRFVVENLVPGEYTIEVVQRPQWPERSARVTVVAGQRASVRITS